MKKTTSPIIATSLISMVLTGGMFMIGLDATRTSAAAATITSATTTTSSASQAIVNANTNPNWKSSVTLRTVPATTSSTRTTLRTSAS